MKTPLTFDIKREDYGRFFSLKAWKGVDSDGRVIAMQPVNYISYKWDEAPQCPVAMELPEESIQSLMNALWEAGIRPAKGHGSTGQLAAVQDHLNDTRTLLAKVTDALIAQLPSRQPIKQFQAGGISDEGK
jgi:hypothetical protein